MRITKKFAGNSSVGKRVFHPCQRTQEKLHEMSQAQQELMQYERSFLSRLNQRKLNGRRPLIASEPRQFSFGACVRVCVSFPSKTVHTARPFSPEADTLVLCS